MLNKTLKNMDNENKDELKQEETTPAGEAQPTEKPEGDKPLSQEELEKQLDEQKKINEELTADKAKVEEEKENYKRGMLSAKAKKISLDDEEEDIHADVVEPTQAQPTPIQEIDEDGWEEVDRRAESKVNAVLEAKTKKDIKANEQIAIKTFMTSHPEILSNDSLMIAIKEEYVNKSGKSIEGIKLDLEKAYRIYKMENKLITPDNKPSDATREIASTPSSPSGEPSNPAGFNDSELQVMKQFEIKPESFKQFKEKVAKGEMDVPTNVYNLLFNN